MKKLEAMLMEVQLYKIGGPDNTLGDRFKIKYNLDRLGKED